MNNYENFTAKPLSKEVEETFSNPQYMIIFTTLLKHPNKNENTTRTLVVSSKELLKALHLEQNKNGERELRELIRQMKVLGFPLCSCTEGYFLSCEKEDIQRQVNRTQGTIRKHYQTIKPSLERLRRIREEELYGSSLLETDHSQNE